MAQDGNIRYVCCSLEMKEPRSMVLNGTVINVIKTSLLDSTKCQKEFQEDIKQVVSHYVTYKVHQNSKQLVLKKHKSHPVKIVLILIHLSYCCSLLRDSYMLNNICEVLRIRLLEVPILLLWGFSS
jgi:hypothetical protein